MKVLKDSWIDVILSDIHMPVMDGLDLLKQLQNDDLYKTIPVIIITTEGREPKLDEAMSLGARAYIRKPFTPEVIRQTLTEVLGDEYVSDNQGEFEGSDF